LKHGFNVPYVFATMTESVAYLSQSCLKISLCTS